MDTMFILEDTKLLTNPNITCVETVNLFNALNVSVN